MLRLIRTLHIYLTMLGLGLMLFFSATGFMLNHDDWFLSDEPRTREQTGTLPLEVVQQGDRLAVAETLRARFGVRGLVNSFEADERSLDVLFRAPGSKTRAQIDRASAQVKLTFEHQGVAALLTDLHKGAGAGPWWKLCIDAAAILLMIASLTGLLLCVSVGQRRKLGLAALALGAGLCALTYVLLVR